MWWQRAVTPAQWKRFSAVLEAGAHTIGYTCETFEATPTQWLDQGRTQDPHVDFAMQRMADESDAFVVVHGGLGTLASWHWCGT